MLLIVENDYMTRVRYHQILSTLFLFEEKDYLFAFDYDDAKELFAFNRDQITAIVTDHHLVGETTGLDVAFAIRRNQRNEHITIVSCSDDCHVEYPHGTWYATKDQFYDMIRELTGATAFPHPCIRNAA